MSAVAAGVDGPPPAAAVTAYEPVEDARVTRVGVYLGVGADVFFFAAWFFAFFYLRALNNNSAWMADGVNRPSLALGVAVALLAVLSAGAYFLAARGVRFGTLGGVALLLGLGACAVQLYQLWHLGFGMTDGGYPSVFAGLAGTWVFQFLVAMLWLASVVVQARAGGDSGRRPYAASAFGYFLYFLAAIEVLAFLVLYFV